MTWLTVVLVALSTYRLTRLITADRIMDRFRDWCQSRGDFIAYLTSCDWCLSIWIAPPVAGIAVIWGDNRAVIAGLLALSASAITGLLSLGENRLDRQ